MYSLLLEKNQGGDGPAASAKVVLKTRILRGLNDLSTVCSKHLWYDMSAKKKILFAPDPAIFSPGSEI